MPLSRLLKIALTTACAVILVPCGPGVRDVLAQGAPSSGGAGNPAARIGSEVIGLDEVEKAVAPQLAELEQQRYNLLSEKLDELIGERLLAQEAARQNISVEELLRTRVFAQVPEVSDAEVTAFINQNRARMPKNADEGELRVKVRDYLRSQHAHEQRETFVKSLHAKTQVTTYLKEPPVVRVQVSPDKGFARGDAGAKVTVVEFTDFGCPFCKNVTPTLKQILADYPGKVKLVFRDYPIAGLHPTAPKAHEAARCAAAQGKFWEYHDILFERAPRHAQGELKQYAQELKLDATAFNECLDTGRYGADVEADVQEGTRLGINGTPTFFINGRQFVGAQPLAEFKKVIEKELAAN